MNKKVTMLFSEPVERRRFTLVEIMVVIAILILVSALAYSYIGKTPSTLNLRKTACEIERVLLTARLQASLRGTSRDVVFDSESKTFSLAEAAEAGRGAEIDSEMSAEGGCRESCGIPENIAVSFSGSNVDEPRFTFFSDGSASCPETRLEFKGHVILVSVSKLTGMVRIVEESEPDGT
ncbi:MAG: hypothetical protein KAG97_04275 [Victivallales bacterium]|nr:hypothetical protein [Victivallales bacterium]